MGSDLELGKEVVLKVQFISLTSIMYHFFKQILEKIIIRMQKQKEAKRQRDFRKDRKKTLD